MFYGEEIKESHSLADEAMRISGVRKPSIFRRNSIEEEKLDARGYPHSSKELSDNSISKQLNSQDGQKVQ